MKLNDSSLKKVAKKYEQDWISTYPNELELKDKYTFTKKHNKKIQRLLKSNGNFFYSITSNNVRKVATIIVVLFIGFNTLMLTSIEARNAVSNFIVEIHENVTYYIFSNHYSLKEISNYTRPTYIPNGYSIFNIYDNKYDYYIEYKNTNDETIYYTQNIINDYIVEYKEQDKIEDIEINKNQGFITFDANSNQFELYLFDNKYLYHLIGGNKNEIVKMAESLKVARKF